MLGFSGGCHHGTLLKGTSPHTHCFIRPPSCPHPHPDTQNTAKGKQCTDVAQADGRQQFAVKSLAFRRWQAPSQGAGEVLFWPHRTLWRRSHCAIPSLGLPTHPAPHQVNHVVRTQRDVSPEAGHAPFAHGESRHRRSPALLQTVRAPPTNPTATAYR